MEPTSTYQVLTKYSFSVVCRFSSINVLRRQLGGGCQRGRPRAPRPRRRAPRAGAGPGPVHSGHTARARHDPPGAAAGSRAIKWTRRHRPRRGALQRRIRRHWHLPRRVASATVDANLLRLRCQLGTRPEPPGKPEFTVRRASPPCCRGRLGPNPAGRPLCQRAHLFFWKA